MIGITLEGVSAQLCKVYPQGKAPGELNVEYLDTLLSYRESESRMREAQARVRAALDGSGMRLLLGTVFVEGSVRASLDLAIALALAPRGSAKVLAIGELSLSGKVQPTRGVLSALEAAYAADIANAIVPASSAELAGLWLHRWPGLEVYAVDNLQEAFAALAGDRRPIQAVEPPRGQTVDREPDFGDIIDEGLLDARFAAEVAAAGGHSLLMIGPPGSGKTMIARRIPGIMTPLGVDPLESTNAAFEVASIEDAAGLTRGPYAARSGQRPFRAPHHTASEAALFGGGRPIRPGELTLAHRGVLFLDEVTEFRHSVIERIAHHNDAVVFPKASLPAAAPLIVAAMNPCPCGYAGSATRRCCCTISQIERHHWRMYKFLTHVDLRVLMPQARLLSSGPRSERSITIRERVAQARAILASVIRPTTRVARVAQTIAALRARTETTDDDYADARVLTQDVL